MAEKTDKPAAPVVETPTAVIPTIAEIDASKPVQDPGPPPLVSYTVSIEGSPLPAQLVKNCRSEETAKYTYCRANSVVIQNQRFLITKV